MFAGFFLVRHTHKKRPTLKRTIVLIDGSNFYFKLIEHDSDTVTILSPLLPNIYRLQ